MLYMSTKVTIRNTNKLNNDDIIGSNDVVCDKNSLLENVTFGDTSLYL